MHWVQVVACGGASTHPSISYVCQEPNRGGSLDVEKCNLLKVKKGRNYAELKSGAAVVNLDGEVVYPHQACHLSIS
jgi:hypothetical protein